MLLQQWFHAQGWTPHQFQVDAWHAYLRGASGLIQVPTGAGKTYAAYIGPLAEMIDELHAQITANQRDLESHLASATALSASSAVNTRRRTKKAKSENRLTGIHTLYITPLRAVTRDIELALKRPIIDLNLPITIESRTGDTSAALRAKQRERLPNILVTTPESLCLLLTRESPPAQELFATLRCVIVDEWHDLLTSKRGSSTELALARLRRWNPNIKLWGMSATLPNSEDALNTLCGVEKALGTGHWALAKSENKPHQGASISVRRSSPQPVENSATLVPSVQPPVPPRTIIRADITRDVEIKAVIPKDLSRLPWAGHLGLKMLPDVLDQLDPSEPTLVFTNTRSQAERWFHAIEFAKPEWKEILALHHGSVDREERERVEAGLKDGSIRIVVSTSSLDLGVDFSPVQKILQIGSPKGIARIVQRAGRANHRPGESSVVHCVPTHALELIETVAAREAFARGDLEPRLAMEHPLDVLAQHMVTCALGGGFKADELFDEVRTAWSYQNLTRSDFDWTLDLVSKGGVLSHYPQFQRIQQDEHGVWRVQSKRIAQLHRLNVGTITGDATLEIRYMSGKRLGVIDEGFVAGLRPNQKFVFAGKVLALVMIQDLVVLVKPAPGSTTNTPIWAGTRLPISESLAQGIRLALERAGNGDLDCPELVAAQKLVRTQQRLSKIPRADEVLAETTTTREGTHLFLFPFDGRLVHAGIASLIALRLSRIRKATFSLAVNDYGLELLSSDAFPFEELLTPELFTTDNIAEDVAQSVNMTQLARLAFRDVARVAGLVLQNYPGARRTGKQVQVSSSLIFDVFQDFDPGNLLLHQARREVLDRHFERSRLGRTLERLRTAPMNLIRTHRLTPLSFPLVVERAATTMSSETIVDRLRKMQEQWEQQV